jgi:hypothetical protein
MELDVRADGRAEAILTAEPSDGDIARGLSVLDQDRHTELALVDENGGYLIVNGGRGRYHVYLGAVAHDDRVVLQSPDGSDRPVELFVSGRRTTFPDRDVVDLGRAAAAITEFLRSGRPHPGLTWRIT